MSLCKEIRCWHKYVYNVLHAAKIVLKVLIICSYFYFSTKEISYRVSIYWKYLPFERKNWVDRYVQDKDSNTIDLNKIEKLDHKFWLRTHVPRESASLLRVSTAVGWILRACAHTLAAITTILVIVTSQSLCVNEL